MATFNSMPAMSGATPGPDGLGLNGGPTGLGIDGFDQELQFDESLLNGVNDLPPLSFTPAAYDFSEPFGATFEDPFAYSSAANARPYHEHARTPAGGDAEAFQDEGSSPQELDNKLLGFGEPIVKATVVDDSTGQFSEPRMTAELYGMFFVAEDVFAGESNPGARPLELTCYRRNLWQCSGQVTLPRQVTQCMNEQGRQEQIFELAASISAIESIEGKGTEIISIPWKSSNPAVTGGEETKVAGAPPQVPLDLSAGQELDGNRVSVPVSWKRLQFKHATANNGRRKGLQQHYVVQINLLGKTKSGEWLKIAEIQSGPVIVRGRSPRNFDSRKDVPLTGDKRLERRGTDSSSNGKPERTTDLSQNLQRYHSLGNVQQSNDWNVQQQQQQQQQQTQYIAEPGLPPSKKMALTSPNPSRPPIPAWSPEVPQKQSTPVKPGLTRTNSSSMPQRPGAPTLPINLSLSEDERSPNRSGSETLTSPSLSKSGTVPNPAGSPQESAEALYEYFPLSLDDWMPPVDAIYRPHVVHHTVVPPEVKAQQTQSKTKRYFTTE